MHIEGDDDLAMRAPWHALGILNSMLIATCRDLLAECQPGVIGNDKIQRSGLT